MFDAIRDVLDAEKEATKILDKARDKAARLRSEFSEQESRELSGAQDRADKRLREALSAIRETEDRKMSESQDQIRREIAGFDPRTVEGVDQAIKAGVEGIIATETGPAEEGHT